MGPDWVKILADSGPLGIFVVFATIGLRALNARAAEFNNRIVDELKHDRDQRKEIMGRSSDALKALDDNIKEQTSIIRLLREDIQRHFLSWATRNGTSEDD